MSSSNTLSPRNNDGFTITVSKPLKEGLNKPGFKKWDIVRCFGAKQGIVIRIKNTGEHMTYSICYTVYPVPDIKKKWKFRLWFKWLKVRVWIGDFYK